MKATESDFVGMWKRLGCTADPLPAFKSIENAYSTPNRQYHTLEHIGWGLKRLDDIAEVDVGRGARFDARWWDTVRWAFWFHDFELEGNSQDEARSATMAVNTATYAGLPHKFTDSVARLILSTSHERIPLVHDEATLCDADLSILGAPTENFDHYEHLVRQEWAHVPTHLFATARIVILRRFLARPWIYSTQFGRERWERRARVNLTSSIEHLTLKAAEQ
jgi:predicted metal-dependent HD superfamily phosphohydrolase